MFIRYIYDDVARLFVGSFIAITTVVNRSKDAERRRVMQLGQPYRKAQT